MAAARRTGQAQATAPASSKSSSNAAEPPRTAPHQPRLITAGQPSGGTDSDGLNRARARLLIRGSRVRALEGRHRGLHVSVRPIFTFGSDILVAWCAGPRAGPGLA